MMYKIIQGGKGAGLTTYRFFLYMYRRSMTQYVGMALGKIVGNWDQEEDVENDEKNGGMCEKCCDAGRGNI